VQKKTEDFDKKRMVRAMASHQRKMGKCGFCPESDMFKQHRTNEIWSMTESIDGAYLCAVGYKHAIHRYHFRIVPTLHCPSIVSMEEETNEHIRNYQKLMVAFFETKGMIPLFIETALTVPSKEALLLGGGHHVYLEVIPIPYDKLENAKMHYKESLTTAGEEWSQNPKIIDTWRISNPRIRFPPKGIVPQGIPYVHVDFGLAGGFAHIIENKGDSDIANMDITGKFLREVAIAVLGQSVFEKAFKNQIEWRRNFKLFKHDWRRHTGDSNILADEVHVSGENEVRELNDDPRYDPTVVSDGYLGSSSRRFMDDIENYHKNSTATIVDTSRDRDRRYLDDNIDVKTAESSIKDEEIELDFSDESQ